MCSTWRLEHAQILGKVLVRGAVRVAITTGEHIVLEMCCLVLVRMRTCLIS